MSPSVADLTVPFVSSFNRLWTSVGIACGWDADPRSLLLRRARIGVQRWRRLHRFTAVVWLASIAHALGKGTDAGQAWFLLGVGALVVPAFVLLTVRTGSSTTKGATA